MKKKQVERLTEAERKTYEGLGTMAANAYERGNRKGVLQGAAAIVLGIATAKILSKEDILDKVKEGIGKIKKKVAKTVKND